MLISYLRFVAVFLSAWILTLIDWWHWKAGSLNFNLSQFWNQPIGLISKFIPDRWLDVEYFLNLFQLLESDSILFWPRPKLRRVLEHRLVSLVVSLTNLVGDLIQVPESFDLSLMAENQLALNLMKKPKYHFIYIFFKLNIFSGW